jgi:glutamine---fructose-6-phosphate transaminase (isomerizing)
MCGIIGLSFTNQNTVKPALTKAIIHNLLLLSETRGKDASGIAVSTTKEIKILKGNFPAHRLVKTQSYKDLLTEAMTSQDGSYVSIIGHSRMMTNGNQGTHFNNQPVIKAGMVIIHNGIIVNDLKLWDLNKKLTRKYEVDTEIITSIIRQFLNEGNDLVAAVRKTYAEIDGVASIAVLFEDNDTLLLASNNGSMFYIYDEINKFLVFASEKNMLKKLAVKAKLLKGKEICQVEAGHGCLLELHNMTIQGFNLFGKENTFIEIPIKHTIKTTLDKTSQNIASQVPIIFKNEELKLSYMLQNNLEAIDKLRRCTKCLLPETFPGIIYDNNGVCSICNTSRPVVYKGKEALENVLVKYRRNLKSPDLILPLSGGRDSTYALHYLKEEMGMNPVAYTYDWGMVTDLARRNISRITSKLGIEHILISADIGRKRLNIKKNVEAWLKRPTLGTIPLFMAGDKQYFYYANMLRKQLDIDILIFGMNPLERTDFKVAYTGIVEKHKEDRHYHLSLLNKAKIAAYYGKEYLLNRSYINTSIADTFFAYLSYYFIPHNYEIFFEYINWDETIINNTIINQYNWELATDTKTTWRIGDGTAAFYNYIYFTLTGFSENDTFRSNQIRQGIITREEALQLIVEENAPRYESIKWYLDTIGVDFYSTIKVINSIPKLYKL